MLSGEIPSPRQSGRGVLLIHDLHTATLPSLLPSTALSENGYPVFTPFPPGWGNTPESMSAALSDPLTVVRMAFSRLREECAPLAVAGIGFGGVLALLLAEEIMPDAIVTISAPLFPADIAMSTAPAAILPFRTRALLRRLVNRARRNLFAVTAPILAVHQETDPPAAPSSTGVILSGVSSPVRQELLLQPQAEPSRLRGAVLAFLNQNTEK